VEGQGFKGTGIVRHAGTSADNVDLLNLNLIGVELDEAIGDNDGTFGGHPYFTCKANHGVVVLPKNVSKPSDVSKLRKQTGYRILDQYLWEWSEHDDDAKASVSAP